MRGPSKRFVARERDAVEDPAAEPPAIAETRDLGWMLHDLDFSDVVDPQPRFFRALMQQGLIDVPAFDAQEVSR